jgi:hypothetical protein
VHLEMMPAIFHPRHLLDLLGNNAIELFPFLFIAVFCLSNKHISLKRLPLHLSI